MKCISNHATGVKKFDKYDTSVIIKLSIQLINLKRKQI